MSSKKTDRREFLKQGAALAGGAAVGAASQSASGQLAGPETFIQGSDDMVAYGSRSRFVTSKRIPHGGRHSPDTFGLDFHIATPLQEQHGVVTPSSLFYMGTTRGSYLPDIDPEKHRLMIQIA